MYAVLRSRGRWDDDAGLSLSVRELTVLAGGIRVFARSHAALQLDAAARFVLRMRRARMRALDLLPGGQ